MSDAFEALGVALQVLAYTLLGWSGVHHLLRPARSAQIMASHPFRLAPRDARLVRVLGSVECLLAALGWFGIMLGAIPLQPLVNAATALCFMAFFCYAIALRRSRAPAGCGCFGVDTPVSRRHIVLNAILATALAIAAVRPGIPTDVTALAFCIAAGVGVGAAAAFVLGEQLANLRATNSLVNQAKQAESREAMRHG